MMRGNGIKNNIKTERCLATRVLPEALLALACLVFSCRTGGPTAVVPLDEAGKKQLQSMQRFTVIVTQEEVGGTDAANNASIKPGNLEIRAYRGSQITSRTTTIPDFGIGLPLIDRFWGEKLQSMIREKGGSAVYIPVEKLSLSAHESDSDCLEWMKAVGIDTVVLIKQKKLNLDYSSRLPASTTSEILATVFLWADFWWIDNVGTYYLENEVDIALLHPGAARTYETGMKGIYAKSPVGARFYKDLNPEAVAKALVETNEKNLLTFKEGL